MPCLAVGLTRKRESRRMEKPAKRQRLYEAAKSEGEAMVYANMDVSAMKPLTDGFMKRYPARKRPACIFPAPRSSRVWIRKRARANRSPTSY